MPAHKELSASPGSSIVVMEPTRRRLRVVFNGEVVADSADARVMYETHHLPVYSFPVSNVRMDLLEPTDHGST